MKGYVITNRGDEYVLPAAVSWSAEHTSGESADAFEYVCRYDASMLDTLSESVRFRGVFGGETVFYGIVDEFEITADSNGLLVTICGRGLAGVLMDNEALPVEYSSSTVGVILQNHVYPYGITDVLHDSPFMVSGLSVESGWSQWRVLKEFLHRACGKTPRFSPQGTLVLNEKPGKSLHVGEWSGAYGISYCGRRYGVISSVTVRRYGAGKLTEVENEKFLDSGGACRRTISVPARTSVESARREAEYQIYCSEKDCEICTIFLPRPFAAFPGDEVFFTSNELGTKGNFTVYETESFADGKNTATRIELIPKGE